MLLSGLCVENRQSKKKNNNKKRCRSSKTCE